MNKQWASARSKPIHLLFVCSQNRWRSLTAEHLLRNQPGVQARSVGTSQSARRRVGANDIIWADVICCMEKKHKELLQQRFAPELHNKQVEVFDIPDLYPYMDQELVELLTGAIQSLNLSTNATSFS